VTAIELSNLTKIFKNPWRRKGTTAVDHMNLTVGQGEVFGLLGRNGAGKTTVVQLILGLLRPTCGEIKILGKPPTDLRVRREIGYMPETPRFHAYLSGEEFLQFHGELYGLAKSQNHAIVEKLLADFEMAKEKNRRIWTYSRGMVQRIGLAQSLLSSPQVLLLDEPTSGLDPIGVGYLRDLILDLKDRGVTVFLNSHILSEVERVCDRVAFMRNGSIVGTVDLRLRDSESREVEIRLRHGIDSLETATEDWRVLEMVAHPDHTVVLVQMQDDGTVNDVIDAIRRKKGEILSVTPRETSLEQLFLRHVSEI
jgi:ABC-2 type transport system ATP-binding protein